MKSINQATRAYAHRLLQCLTVAARPLRLEELAEVLAFDFDDAPGGIPQLNVDWRRKDQERVVLSMCSSLIAVVHDGDSRVVQFSHFSVKEFLTSDRLAVAAADDISFYHIAPHPAHTIFAQACLGVLLRLDDSSREASMQQFPLAEYALEHWVDHALFENVLPRIKDGVEDLFDVEKPHFSRWIRVGGDMDYDYSWAAVEADTPEQEAVPMYCAAFCGFHHVIEKLIRKNPENVGARGGLLGTALHAASRKNRLEVVQSLLRHGADVNAPGLWKRTPLLFALVEGHLEVVRWLLEHGADLNAKDEGEGETSLHLAAFFGHFEIVRMLLKNNVDINAWNHEELTPLLEASICGHVDVVRLLLDHGADPNIRGKRQQTSLHRASSLGYLDIARLLLEHGAEVDAIDDDGRTAYQIALDKRHNEVAQFLSAHGAKTWQDLKQDFKLGRLVDLLRAALGHCNRDYTYLSGCSTNIDIPKDPKGDSELVCTNLQS